MSTVPAATAPTPIVPSHNHRRLDATETRTVLVLLAERGFGCPGCPAAEFTVGDALDMGTIWPDEPLGTHMVALTCRRCGTPTGIRLPASELFTG